MPVRIRFTGPATLNSTLTVSWQGGYPPGSGGTASAVQTFKTVRTTNFETTRGTTANIQATNYYNAMSLDFLTNFTITQIGDDVILNPKNGTPIVTATTSSANIVINPSLAQIQMLGSPQAFMPVYNPITYKFFSNNYSLSGYRYLVDVYNSVTNEKIYSAKVSPQIDGTGYIDISKPLSNFLSVDWTSNSNFKIDCKNSYIKTTTYIGEEFTTNWLFSQITTATGSYAGKCQVTQSPNVTPHTYIVGDQLNITTTLALSDPMSIVNGLHTVMSVPNSYSVIIDSDKPTVGTISTAGIISYADGRKTSYSNVVSNQLTSFNGVRTWVDFTLWNYEKWFVEYGSGAFPLPRFLTSLDISLNMTSPEKYFYMTPSQILWINFAVDDPTKDYTVQWFATNVNGSVLSGAIDLLSGTGTIQQFRFCPVELIPSVNSYIKVSFGLYDDTSELVTQEYIAYLDKRCVIEQYELYFMDRMGSILSFACQLRAKETGTITREMGKQQVYYNEQPNPGTPPYDTTDRGMTINSVNLVKELELNTNWMNNYMSLLFEELLTSPFVWLRTIPDPTNDEEGLSEVFTSVVVTETSFEVQKQKNKKLIRKTISVKSANEDIINI
jgi:hypothetical protein